MRPCHPEADARRRRITVFIRGAVILLIVGGAAAYLLMRSGEFSQSLSVAQRFAWSVLVLGVVAQLLSYFFAGELLRATLRQTGHTLGRVRATIIQIASSTLSMLPGGSVSCTPAIYRWTRDGGVPPFQAAVSGVVSALFNAASLLAFGLLSAVLLIAQHRLSGNEAIALVIISAGIVATIVAAVLAATWPPALRFMLALAQRIPLVRRTSLAKRADDRIAQVRATVSKLRAGQWGRAATSAVLNMTFDAATLGIVFYAAGAKIGVATLFAGYGLPIMLGQASFLPGGLAVTEVSMSAVFISLGLTPSVVIASVITYRLLSLWLPALAGLPLIAYLEKKGLEPKPRIDSRRRTAVHAPRTVEAPQPAHRAS